MEKTKESNTFRVSTMSVREIEEGDCLSCLPKQVHLIEFLLRFHVTINSLELPKTTSSKVLGSVCKALT